MSEEDDDVDIDDLLNDLEIERDDSNPIKKNELSTKPPQEKTDITTSTEPKIILDKKDFKSFEGGPKKINLQQRPPTPPKNLTMTSNLFSSLFGEETDSSKALNSVKIDERVLSSKKVESANWLGLGDDLTPKLKETKFPNPDEDLFKSLGFGFSSSPTPKRSLSPSKPSIDNFASDRLETPASTKGEVKGPAEYFSFPKKQVQRAVSQEKEDRPNPLPTPSKSKNEGDKGGKVDVLPFLRKKVRNKDEGDQSGDTGERRVKGTLNLPTHLVDEEELKSMCSGLKSLYGNQLEMLEKSYQEQIQCLTQSHVRKEELLKEEIKSVHKDYEIRVERLKKEVLELESNLPGKLQKDIESSHEDATRQMLAKLKSHLESSQPQQVNILPDIERIVESKIMSFTHKILPVLQNKAENENYQEHLNSLTNKLDLLIKENRNVSEKEDHQIKDLDKKLIVEVGKITKEQKKMKETIVKDTVKAIKTAIEESRDEGLKKKDKVSTNFKNFRKDMRKFFMNLESKEEKTSKFQLNVETEQKQLQQNFRELSQMVQRVQSSMENHHQNQHQNQHQHNNGQLHPFSQFAMSPAVEYELKLLKEERTSFGESIAQLNVERRKLAEEKMNFEREKMEIERERGRLSELEMSLRGKLVEAEDHKQIANKSRKEEKRLKEEITYKTKQLEREKTQMKEQFGSMEQKIKLREQQYFHNKSELMREKEYIEKLRDQLLCPGCLKSLTVCGNRRSDGDGLDFRTIQQINPMLRSNHLNLSNDSLNESLFDKHFQ